MMFNREQLGLGVITSAMLFLAYGPSILGAIKLDGLFKRTKGNKKVPHIKIANQILTDDARLRHTHILGATGTGKTVLLEQLIFEDLARGYGMFIIDPKGDRDLFERVKDFCKMIGREEDLHLLSASYPEESVSWNPCRLGDAGEIQSKFLNSWNFSEVYYAKACEAMMLEAMNALGNAPHTLNELVEALKKISERKKDDAGRALFLDLYNTTKGEWGEILCAGLRAGKEINLLDITRKNEILFVDLPTEGKSAQSSRIGKLLLQEILLISGMRKTYPHLRTEKPFPIYIDEFDAFATPSFATFLNKGRSSGFMVHICHQTLSDLLKVDNGAGMFLGQVQGNVNNRFFFRIDDPKDAENIAAFFGTKISSKMTTRVIEGSATSDGSLRETLEFRVHPDEIKELGIGECIFSSKTTRTLERLKLELANPKKYRKPRPILRAATSFETIEREDPIDARYGNLLKKTQRKKELPCEI